MPWHSVISVVSSSSFDLVVVCPNALQLASSFVRNLFMHGPITNNGGQHVVLLPDISQVLLQGRLHVKQL